MRTLRTLPLQVTERTPDAHVWVNVDRCMPPTRLLATLQSVRHAWRMADLIPNVLPRMPSTNVTTLGLLAPVSFKVRISVQLPRQWKLRSRQNVNPLCGRAFLFSLWTNGRSQFLLYMRLVVPCSCRVNGGRPACAMFPEVLNVELEPAMEIILVTRLRSFMSALITRPKGPGCLCLL